MSEPLNKNKMNPIADADQRQQALDPTRSFIIQAPAGSGKTELLTQRFLNLLSYTNKAPEEIIAITFTRKAAGEMRARIIKALEDAANNPAPELPHTLTTWRLASNVLKRDKELNWNLLENSNRLQIQTIDSLCGKITAQMPILSKFGAQPSIIDDAESLYAETAREILSTLADDIPWVDALTTLLLHLDNDHAKAERLLVGMLACRDQWLPHVISANPRQVLEQALANMISEQLTQLTSTLPHEFTSEYLPLIRYAASNIKQQAIDSPILTCLDMMDLPEPTPDDHPKWRGLIHLLLTQKKEWRKKFTKKEGFPAPSSAKNSQEKERYTSMKQRMQAFIERLAYDDELHQQLQNTLALPPAHYTDEQWQTIEALIKLLPILVAQLQLSFQRAKKVDHTEIALQALAALGKPEAPTDLALTFDYKIQHLLVDEFQDTSLTQFELLQKLTAGWQNGDGRTLFLVGDPMQSIYRFRKAEVGIFLQAREVGIGDIKLHPLLLSVNFRSQKPVIDWINQTFTHVLPKKDDIASSAISFHPSTPAPHPEEQNQQQEHQQNSIKMPDSNIVVHPLVIKTPLSEEEQSNNDDSDDTAQEANTIVKLIQEAWQIDPEASIAILVRSRNHLIRIIPALQKADINYRAIEIEKLAHKTVVQDLLALTKALLHLGDRTAWLAILRAPWCGLTLEDLLAIAGDDKRLTIWHRLSKCESLKLTPDGQLRLQRILPTLKQAVTHRRRESLALWIEHVWFALGGPACVSQPNELQDANAFFQLLAASEQGGDILDFSLLEKQLMALAATPQNHTTNAVDIMTIHKSKGLEFDIVILPSLDKKTRGDDHQLLTWQEIPTTHGTSELLLAPIKTVKPDPIYDYLRLQEQIKSRFETGRLLYVAATRAKQSLHLLAHCKSDLQNSDAPIKSFRNSLLEQLWPQLETQFLTAIKESNASETAAPTENKKDHNNRSRRLRRLTANWQSPIIIKSESETVAYQRRSPQLRLENSTRRHIGTLVHRLLQQISKENLDKARLNKPQIPDIQKNLISLGVPKSNLEDAANQVLNAIENMLDSERGQWILDNRHQEAQSEYPITTTVNGKIQHIIIDRTFVEDNSRWIIDYKTADFIEKSPEQLDNFLKDQKKLYETQLEDYAIALSLIDARPIRLGLYFPLLNAWKDWAYYGEPGRK